MSNKIWLITMGSWEDRFFLGVDHLLKTDNLDGITVVYSRAFSTETADNRAKVAKNAVDAGVFSNEVEVDFEDQVKTYLSLESLLTELTTRLNSSATIFLDISTMPRELIWMCFTLCKDNALATRWAYFPPEKYGEEWLTKEPDAPRMVLRKSGITQYGKQTAVVVVTGFDSARVMKAITYFEPGIVMLGVQVGDQYENLKRNADEQRAQLRPELCNISTFDINAYSEDYGVQSLNDVIESLLPNYNVLLTSQGPKPSSVAAYQIATLHPEVGLFYVPALEYNPDYSKGIRTDLAVQGRTKLPLELSMAHGADNLPV